MKDVEDRLPVADLVWFRRDCLELFGSSDVDVAVEHKALGRDHEPYNWLTETGAAMAYLCSSPRIGLCAPF